MKKNQKKTSRKILAVFLLFFFSTFICQAPYSKAALDQWNTISPSGTTGYSFNTIATIDDYVFLGTDHGIYRSLDRGQTWTQINTGLVNQNITSLSIGWTYNFETFVYEVSGATDIYASTPDGVYKNTLAGNAWTPVITSLTDTNIKDIEIDQYSAVINSTPTTLFAATYGATGANNGVYKSVDSGATWAQTDDAILADEKIIKLTSDALTGIIYALSDTNKLYASPLESFSATPESWSLIYDGSATAINDLSVVPASGAFNLLATSAGVLQSDGADTTWTPVNSGLTDLDITSVANDFTLPNISYAASTDGGIFKSTSIDTGSISWTPINAGLIDTNIKEIKTNPTSSGINNFATYAVGELGAYRLDLTAADGLPSAGDSTPPARIEDFTATGSNSQSITLVWTAPGDNGDTGTASNYDLRYSTATINDSNWDSAIPATGVTAPHPADTIENHTVSGLSPETTYYFAIKATDASNNTSPLSVVTSTSTKSIIYDVPPSQPTALSVN